MGFRYAIRVNPNPKIVTCHNHFLWYNMAF